MKFWLVSLGIGVASLLFWQSFNAGWQGHLQTDVIIHHQQAQVWWQDKSWQNIDFKEYQPGALLWFVVPHILEGFKNNYGVYLNATLFLNWGLILAHGWLYWKEGRTESVLIFLLMLAAMGPILLFRFELLVSLLVLQGWRYWRQNNNILSGSLIGLAVAIKLYPVVLLSVLYKGGRKWLLGLILGGGSLINLFVWSGGSSTDIQAGLTGYSIKPVSLDSVWGSILSLSGLVWPERSLNVSSDQGIHGFIEPSIVWPLDIYNYVWVIPLLVLLAVFRRRKINYKSWWVIFSVLGVFVMSSKIINPQYVWWFLCCLPLVIKDLRPKEKLLLGGGGLLALYLTQIVYPVNYFEFLDWYYNRSQANGLIVAMIFRNIILLGIVGLAIKMALQDRQDGNRVKI
jgi:hypothetical protein